MKTIASEFFFFLTILFDIINLAHLVVHLYFRIICDWFVFPAHLRIKKRRKKNTGFNLNTYPGLGFGGSQDCIKDCRKTERCWPFSFKSLVGTRRNMRPSLTSGRNLESNLDLTAPRSGHRKSNSNSL